MKSNFLKEVAINKCISIFGRKGVLAIVFSFPKKIATLDSIIYFVYVFVKINLTSPLSSYKNPNDFQNYKLLFSSWSVEKTVWSFNFGCKLSKFYILGFNFFVTLILASIRLSSVFYSCPHNPSCNMNSWLHLCIHISPPHLNPHLLPLPLTKLAANHYYMCELS